MTKAELDEYWKLVHLVFDVWPRPAVALAECLNEIARLKKEANELINFLPQHVWENFLESKGLLHD